MNPDVETAPARGEADSAESSFERMVRIHAESRRDGVPALMVLHSRYGGGSEVLVKEWRRHLHDERDSLFEGTCQPGGGTYRPLREIVSGWVGKLDDLGLLDAEITELVADVGGSLGMPTVGFAPRDPTRDASAIDQLRFFEILGRLLGALSHRLPAALIIHDLHVADSATRAALEYVLENVVTDPVQRFAPVGARGHGFRGMVVVTASERGGTLDRLRSALDARENAWWISLRDIEEEQIRLFLQSDDVIGQLMAASGGAVENLEELLRSLPGRVEDLFLRRVERLERAERRVLEALAVIGTPVKPDLLLRLVDDRSATPSLPSLAEDRLIVRHVSRGEMLVGLPSEANRRALYERIPGDRRQVLHGRVGAMLEERSRIGESVNLEEIAFHYLRSNVVEKALEYGLEAAERLHISFAYERARDILASLLPRLDDRESRAGVLERLVELCAALNDHEAALERCREHIEVTELERHATILRKQAEILLEMGSYDDALQRIDAARTLARDRLPEVERDSELLMLTSVEAEAHYGLGDYDEATRVALDGLEVAGGLDTASARRQAIHLTNTLGKVHLFLGDYERAGERFDENRRCARDLAWPEEEVRALFNRGTIALQQREYEEAERVFAECVAFGSQTANPITRAFLQLNLAVVYHKTLRYGDALDAYLSSLATFKQSGNDLQFAVTAMNLGSLYETLGQHDKAQELLRTSIEVTTRRDIKYFHGRSLYVLGTLACDAGNWGAATDAFEKADAVLVRTGSATFGDRIRIGLARAAHGLGSRATRDDHMTALELTGDGHEDDEVRGLAHLWRGYFALQDNDLSAAASPLESALSLYEQNEVQERVWLARLFLAHARAALGDLTGARTLLRAAAELVGQIGRGVPEALRDTYLRDGFRGRILAALDTVESGRVPRLGGGAEAARLPGPSVDPGYQRWRSKYASIVGEDSRLLQIFRMIDRISGSDSTALIQGPSGTGKELIAEAIHTHSPRAEGPFVKVNCAAFVETLLLSELFGHERGAFTGAMARKKGRFELAHGGTLFLDEIGDISQNTQVALLRVLQEHNFERVGGSETVEVDVRLICATNRNLEEMVRQGGFRLDLYYRLKGVVIELPALGERRADIPALVDHFCRQYAQSGGAVKRFGRDALEYLVRYSWPGNIRELQNFVRSILLFVEGDRIELPDVRQFDDFFADGEFLDEPPPFMADYERPGPVVEPSDVPPVRRPGDEVLGQTPEEQIATLALEAGIGLQDLKRKLEVELIRRALIETDANITQAARILDMKRPRLSQIVNATPELAELKDELASK